MPSQQWFQHNRTLRLSVNLTWQWNIPLRKGDLREGDAPLFPTIAACSSPFKSNRLIGLSPIFFSVESHKTSHCSSMAMNFHSIGWGSASTTSSTATVARSCRAIWPSRAALSPGYGPKVSGDGSDFQRKWGDNQETYGERQYSWCDQYYIITFFILIACFWLNGLKPSSAFNSKQDTKGGWWCQLALIS